jgi:hypothetical protein
MTMYHTNRALFFLLLFVFGCARAGGADPKAFPPDDWTHKELAAHLAKKGVKVGVDGVPLYSTDGRTAAAFNGGAGKGAVLVYLCRDARQARETAGAMGAKAAHFGRFAVGPFPNDAGSEFLDDVVKALAP